MANPGTRCVVTAALADRLRPVLAECRRELQALSAGGQDAGANIHFLRKNSKRLRGGLEMLGADKPALAELRDLGRLLSMSRDALVRVQTQRALVDKLGPDLATDPDFEVARRQLEFEARLSGTPPTPTRRFVRARLDAVQAWLDAARFDDPAVVARRMDRLVARATQRIGRLADKPKRIDAYHDARKAAKALLGAAQFLFDPPGASQAREIHRLDQLGEDFGWIQDLCVLQHWLNARGLGPERLPAFHRALDTELRKTCAVTRRHAAKCALAALRPRKASPAAPPAEPPA